MTGTSNIQGNTGKKSIIVVKGTNFCPDGNPSCENGKSHFDIAAPGFDFPGASISDTCSKVQKD